MQEKRREDQAGREGIASLTHRFLGCGVGLRHPHYSYLLERQPKVDWFEALTENYLIPGGRPLDALLELSERYSIALHGVSLSIGSADPLDWEYLREVKRLADRIQPAWISDHLCWASIGGHHTHDLLPLPHTEEAVRHVATRVREVQDFLGRRILLENISSYVSYRISRMTEWEFLIETAGEADCEILLDLNNIYVNSVNHEFAPETYVNAIPRERVRQFHLAGHSRHEKYLLDTHDDHVIDPVWDLYRRATARFGKISTLIEWDDKIPAFEILLDEAERARRIQEETLSRGIDVPAAGRPSADSSSPSFAPVS